MQGIFGGHYVNEVFDGEMNWVECRMRSILPCLALEKNARRQKLFKEISLQRATLIDKTDAMRWAVREETGVAVVRSAVTNSLTARIARADLWRRVSCQPLEGAVGPVRLRTVLGETRLLDRVRQAADVGDEAAVDGELAEGEEGRGDGVAAGLPLGLLPRGELLDLGGIELAVVDDDEVPGKGAEDAVGAEEEDAVFLEGHAADHCTYAARDVAQGRVPGCDAY